jgi:hypothetical protein
MYPTKEEVEIIREHASSGDEVATYYGLIVQACQEILAQAHDVIVTAQQALDLYPEVNIYEMGVRHARKCLLPLLDPKDREEQS